MFKKNLYIFSVKGLLVFCPFFYWYLQILIISFNFNNSLYTREAHPLSRRFVGNNFCQFFFCLLTLLTVFSI